MTDEITKRAMAWLVGGDTGMSSEAIFATMMAGEPVPEGTSYPADGSDLGRCIRLLAAIPEWRPRFFREMPAVSRVWRALVSEWPVLEGMHRRRDPLLYDRMRQIIDGARKAP